MLNVDLDRLIPKPLQRDKPMDHALWPEHVEAWNVYMGSCSQWRIALGFDRRLWLGLDYQGVEVVRRAQRVPDERWGEVFSQLQTLEDEEMRLRNLGGLPG